MLRDYVILCVIANTTHKNDRITKNDKKKSEHVQNGNIWRVNFKSLYLQRIMEGNPKKIQNKILPYNGIKNHLYIRQGMKHASVAMIIKTHFIV